VAPLGLGPEPLVTAYALGLAIVDRNEGVADIPLFVGRGEVFHELCMLLVDTKGRRWCEATRICISPTVTSSGPSDRSFTWSIMPRRATARIDVSHA
jgi:hypothetical protein